jgi:hypothetical protein
VSQRDSGYARKERDLYETPAWVTEALLPHIGKCLSLWEPAAGSGKMARSLCAGGHRVATSDIHEDHLDFLERGKIYDELNGIVTNPPYVLAQEFIEHALDLMRPYGFVAMLLRTDFDHAKTRQNLFANHRAFAKKVVLTKRIQWFENSKGSPSFNHAWFIWDWDHDGPPTLAYGPLNCPMVEARG